MMELSASTVNNYYPNQMQKALTEKPCDNNNAHGALNNMIYALTFINTVNNSLVLMLLILIPKVLRKISVRNVPF